MKIIIEEPVEGDEEQLIIRCRHMTPELLRVLAYLKPQETITAYDGSEIFRLKPGSLYYAESVDNKTFLYTKDKVFESKQRLYELDEVLDNSDFLRVSKSVILNLSKIKSLNPALNGRFEASLDNGEKVIISRQYVGDLKKRLGIGGGK